MSQKTSIDCYVRVTGEATDADDDGLAGYYLVTVTADDAILETRRGEIATAVLDAFHEKQGISVLDDFEISVHLHDGSLISESDDAESSSVSDLLHAEYIGLVTDSSLPFTALPSPLETLINTYIEAADALQSKQRQLAAYGDELHAFVQARDALKDHPDFSGQLPQTYFSGGDLDPDGTAEGFDRPRQAQ